MKSNICVQLVALLLFRSSPSIAIGGDDGVCTACMSKLVNLADGGVPPGSASALPEECGRCQGRPGKKGPQGTRGSRGPMGLPGPVGACTCDFERLSQVQEEISRKFDDFNKKLLRIPVIAESCFVGISNGVISISDITASSTHPHCPITNIGLYSPISWCALNNNAGQWVQVDLKTPKVISGVVTKGRQNAGQWVTAYKVEYGASESELEIYQEDGKEKIFDANRDIGTPVSNVFKNPVTARIIRIYPVSYHGHKSMRIELLVC